MFGRLKKKKQEEQEGQLKDKKAEAGEVSEKTKRKKQPEYEGSRWTSVVILMVTAVAAIIFYLIGQGFSAPLEVVFEWWQRLGQGTTYIVE
jgi:hypothetical protein